MKLKDREILELIKEHAVFHKKYIEQDCIVSYKDNDKSYYMPLFEFNKIKQTIVRPDREKFFESIVKFNENFINKKVLEIGVADGSNAIRIYNHLKPEKIWLVDPWISQNNRAADRGSNDKQHNEAYEKTKDKFSNKNCEILRDFAKNVPDKFEDEFFDFIYIDGDHSYEGCKIDLDLYYPKLKKGGFFGGHDFTGNWNSLHNKEYGVQKAVSEFLLEQNKKLQFITLCVETVSPDNILPFDWGFIK